MEQNGLISKTGYLNQDYKLFHLNARETVPHRYHYHEFDKVILFLSGRVTYTIEGTSYFLAPGDLLFINHHMIHKSEIDPNIPYERYAIWVNADFLNAHSEADGELSLCFRQAKERQLPLFHPEGKEASELFRLLSHLEEEEDHNGFASRLFMDTLFLQIIIHLNRLALKDQKLPAKSVSFDLKLSELIAYINAHLEEELTVPGLAGRFYMSKSHLMHKFKEGTGYTLHQYILQKRLLKAKSLIQKGTPVTEAASLCGFSEYSTFLRAFKRQFHTLPADFKP